ncbi:MAG TPA: hypothetical protein VFV34_03050 [Blastocatellia bacterium]|nr:hypothetical protein [Blastocatellia bacterium]
MRVRLALVLVLPALAIVWSQLPRASAGATSGVTRAEGSPTLVKLQQSASRGIRLGDRFEITAGWESGHRPPATAKPLSLTSADFDNDGTPDLACGYESGDQGEIAVYRGNVDSTFPNSPEAKARGVDPRSVSPFLPLARSFDLTLSPDFLAAGDFNADGNADLIAGKRGADSLRLMPGDGRGGFAEPQNIALHGRLTALAAGNVDSLDLLPDIIAGVDSDGGPSLLVFRGDYGAVSAQPERILLDAEPAAITLGRVDPGHNISIAVAAGRDVVLIQPGGRGFTVAKRLTYPFRTISVAIGDFSVDHQTRLALVSDDGRVHFWSPAAGALNKASGHAQDIVRSVDLPTGWAPPTTGIITALAAVSSKTGADLLVLDRVNNQIDVIEGDGGETAESASFDVNAPVAVLPMRLNSDALDDLVVLSEGSINPTAALTPTGTIPVSTAADTGVGSLRAAINLANTTPGPDVITFDIGGGGPQVINLASPLPIITDPVTIDGTTQPLFAGTPLIELNGAGAGAPANGLTIAAGQCAVRGLIINRFTANGILVTIGPAAIQSNFIGTNAAGAAASANGANGVLITATGSIVGGTVTAARNVISGNTANGVLIQADTGQNTVSGNLIGTNVAGTTAIPNGGAGVSIVGIPPGLSGANVIGGVAAGARNTISGNVTAGVLFTNGANGNSVVGNSIGTNLLQSAGIPNQAGVSIAASSNNAIGGVGAGAGNLIAFNTQAGVAVASGTGNLILTNSIFSNGALGIDLGPAGITPNDPGDADTGANNLQNSPVLIAAASAAGNTTIVGSLNSTPVTQFTLEFFTSSTCDSSGSGEGQNFIGRVTFTTGASGSGNFTVSFPTVLTLGQAVTATASDPGNNTSEFSNCALVGDVGDLSVTVTASPLTAVTGTNITYTIIVTNDGPGTAVNVTVNDTLPAQTNFVSCSSTTNGVCGGTGRDRTVTFQTLGPKQSAIISIVASVDCSSIDGTTIRNIVTVTAATPDLNTANNSTAVNVTGNPQSSLNKTTTSLGPVKPTFKRKLNKGATDVFILSNPGCSPIHITSARIARTGSAVNSGRISNPDDSSAYLLTAVSAAGVRTLVPLPTPPGFDLAVPAGSTMNLEILFTAVIPALAGKTDGLSANQVIASVNTSRLTLITNAGTITLDATSSVRTFPRIIDSIGFSKSGDNSMTVTVPIYDSDANVNRVRYEFLNGGGGVETALDVDVTQAVSQANLVVGQSFSVSTSFTGDNKGVIGVRVSVFDQDGSSDTLGSSASPITPSGFVVDRGGPVIRVPNIALRPERSFEIASPDATDGISIVSGFRRHFIPAIRPPANDVRTDRRATQVIERRHE